MWSLMVCRRTSLKSRRTGLARHVARMGDRRVAYIVVVGKCEFQRPLGIPGNMWFDNIKKWIFKVWFGGPGLDLSGSEKVQMVGCCECVKELSGATKCE